MAQRRVLIPGTFDLFHIGHFNVLRNASKQGDHLTVAVHVDSQNTKGVDIFYTPDDRADIIRNFRFVDNVVFYERIDELVKDVEFDVLCHGPDNTSDLCMRAYQWCRDNGKGLVEIPRTEGVSSSKIRAFLKDKNI